MSITEVLSGLAARAHEALHIAPGFDIHRAQHVCAFIDAVDDRFEEMVMDVYQPGVARLVEFLVSCDELDAAILSGGSAAAATLRALHLQHLAGNGGQLKLVA